MYTRLIVILVVLGVTGWLHGRWTDRWGQSADVSVAAASLPSVPFVMGEWEGRDITREESEFVMRSDSPQIMRRYVNKTTGATVGLLLTCGRPGGMIIEHYPRQCYRDAGFTEFGDGGKLPCGPAERRGEFYAHTFLKNSPTGTARVRVLWSWSDGRSWSFPDFPRVAFGKQPVLFKLYVTRELLREDDPLTDDPAVSFLQTALPEITAAISPK